MICTGITQDCFYFFCYQFLHPCICVTFLPPLIKQSAFIKITFIFIKLLIDRLGRFKHFYFFHYGWRNVAFTTHIILGHSKLPSYSVATERLTEKTPKFNFCEGQNISRTPWKAFVSVLYLSSFYLRLIWNFYFLSLWIYIYIQAMLPSLWDFSSLTSGRILAHSTESTES